MNKSLRRARRAPPQLVASRRLYRRARSLVSPKAVLRSVDRRFFHPDPLDRPISIRRRDARRVVKHGGFMPRRRSPWLTPAVQFLNPKRISICIRRKIRKEVLHAVGAAGGRVRKPRRNEWSDVSC